jgi:DNA-binding CsgD family transcriptional regulator
MQSRLEQFIEWLEQSKTHEDLQRATEELRELYDVKHIVYHWVNSKGERYGAGTYTPEWVERYLEMDYLRMDPVIIGCLQRFNPVNWKDLDWTAKAAKAMFADALAYGIGNQGLSLPMRGPSGQFAIFTLNKETNDEEWDAFIEKNQRDLTIIAHEFNKRALHFKTVPEDFQKPSLSPRELSAMTLLAKGMSRGQAAAELSISEHTFRVYVEGSRHKLGALNTTHAVACAIKEGLIVV